MSVTAMKMDVACEDSGHQVTPLAPNMCITPAAPSPLPLPYPIMGSSSSLDPGTEKTKINGKKVLNANCKVKKMNGNEAGTQKDITTMQTGARLSPAFTNSDAANTNQFGGRPDRIGDGNFDSGEMRDRIQTARPVFDSSAFLRPVSGRGFYGNSARFILTGPGTVAWNAALHKNWKMKESAVFQFRWEMFNAFNRANFNNPGLNISGGDFGLVTTAQGGRSMLFGLRLDY